MKARLKTLAHAAYRKFYGHVFRGGNWFLFGTGLSIFWATFYMGASPFVWACGGRLSSETSPTS